jgi:hypothetical protein
MFTAKQLREMMRANPFRPFRVYMSDGTSHEVLNHDSAFVERSSLDIGLNPDADGIAADIVRCSILHIVKIEDIHKPQNA